MNVQKKIKVAFFTDILIKDFDGAIKTMYQLIDRIPKDRFEYMFFCGTAPKHDFKYKVYKVPSIVIPFNISYKLALPGLRKNTLLEKLDEFKPDVIHISTPSIIGFYALNYAQRNGIRVLSIYHTHFISYIKYYFKHLPFLINPLEKVISDYYRKIYNNCDIVYVPTQFMINELVEVSGVDRKQLKQWHRGLDVSLFHPHQRNEESLKKLTGNDKPSLLYASRIVWEKNVETLFDIYDEAKAQNLDVNFIIVGNGVAEEAARERMPDAFFLGYLDHEVLGDVYASTDVFVFPSISESFGNVVIEAMACGCVPVIARGGGSQALVEDGVTGLLCEPNDPKDYIEKIKLLLNDKALKARMQQAGYQFTSHMSWDNLTDVYFKDITNLAEKKVVKE